MTEFSKVFLAFTHLVLRIIEWCRESSHIPGSSLYSRGKEKGRLWAYCSGSQRAAQGKDFVQPDSEHQAWTWLTVRCHTEGFCDNIRETVLLQKRPKAEQKLTGSRGGGQLSLGNYLQKPRKDIALEDFRHSPNLQLGSLVNIFLV